MQGLARPKFGRRALHSIRKRSRLRARAYGDGRCCPVVTEVADDGDQIPWARADPTQRAAFCHADSSRNKLETRSLFQVPANNSS